MKKVKVNFNGYIYIEVEDETTKEEIENQVTNDFNFPDNVEVDAEI